MNEKQVEVANLKKQLEIKIKIITIVSTLVQRYSKNNERYSLNTL